MQHRVLATTVRTPERALEAKHLAPGPAPVRRSVADACMLVFDHCHSSERAPPAETHADDVVRAAPPIARRGKPDALHELRPRVIQTWGESGPAQMPPAIATFPHGRITDELVRDLAKPRTERHGDRHFS